jgi:hypothetical protein
MPYELHITGRDDGEVNYRLYSGVFVVGRKDCPVVLGNDKSIRYAVASNSLFATTCHIQLARCCKQMLGALTGLRARHTGLWAQKGGGLTPPNTTAGNTRRYASKGCPLKR